MYTFRSRGVPEMLKELMVKLCSAFPARMTHPAVAEFGAGAGRADEDSTIEEIAQLSKDQDAKTKDHVGRIWGVAQFGCEIA